MLSLLPKDQNPLRLPPWTTQKEAVVEIDLGPFIAASASSPATPWLDVALPTMYSQLTSCVTLKPHVDFWFDESGGLEYTTDDCPDGDSLTYPAESGYWGKFWFVSCAPSENVLAAFGKSSARDNDTLSDMTMIHCQQTTKL